MKKIIVLAFALVCGICSYAQSNLVDVKALIARDYFKLGAYKITGISNDGNLTSNSVSEIPTVYALRAYVAAYAGSGGGGGGILDSVKIIDDTLYQYRAGLVSKTAISLYPCAADFGDVTGLWSDNSSLVTAFGLKQNTIVHPNAAGYFWNGYKQWENKDSSVRASMVATYDSNKAVMTFSPRSNLVLYNKRLPNFDTTNFYGGLSTYNASSRGTRPTSDGFGAVGWITANDSNYFNGIDNSIQFAFDKKNNGVRSRSYDGAAWSSWSVALDSAQAFTSLLTIATGGTVTGGGIGYKKRTASPTVGTDVIWMQTDGTSNMRWWYSTGQYIKFDTAGMGSGNINIMLASITQAGNTYNSPNNLLKINNLGYLPSIDGRNVTNIDVNNFALGAGTARQVLKINNGGTAVQYSSLSLDDITDDGDMALQTKTSVDIRGGVVYGLTRLAAPTATSGTNNNDVWINNSTTNLSFRIGGTDYKALTAENNLSGLANLATSRTNLGLVAIASTGSASDLSTGTLALARLSLSAQKFLANNTGSTAAPAELTFQRTAKQTYSGTDTWDGTAPTTSVAKIYQWQQVDKLVTVTFWITYSGAGVTNTSVDFTWPGDLPIPEEPSARTSNNDVVASGYANVGTGTTNKPNTAKGAYIIRTGSGTYKFNLSFGTIAAKTADFTISYFVP